MSIGNYILVKTSQYERGAVYDSAIARVLLK